MFNLIHALREARRRTGAEDAEPSPAERADAEALVYVVAALVLGVIFMAVMVYIGLRDDPRFAEWLSR